MAGCQDLSQLGQSSFHTSLPSHKSGGVHFAPHPLPCDSCFVSALVLPSQRRVSQAATRDYGTFQNATHIISSMAGTASAGKAVRQAIGEITLRLHPDSRDLTSDFVKGQSTGQCVLHMDEGILPSHGSLRESHKRPPLVNRVVIEAAGTVLRPPAMAPLISPRTLLREQVITTINKLNRDYDLAIQIPDVNQDSASVAKRAEHDAAFARSDKIMRLLTYVSSEQSFLLDKVLHAFDWEALAASEKWLRPYDCRDPSLATARRPKAGFPGEALELQTVLLSVLERATHIIGVRPQSVATAGEHVEGFQPRREPSVEVENPNEGGADPVDSFVRDTDSEYPLVNYAARALPYETRGTIPEQTDLRKSTTPQGIPNISSSDSAANVSTWLDAHPAPGESSPVLSTVYTEISGIGDPSLYKPISGVSEPTEPANLQCRLDATWPKFPHWLIQVPFAIAWEITRIALHCDVDLDEIILSYDETWRDYDTLYRVLREQHPFNGKGFPERPTLDAWTAGLSGFESSNGQHVSFAASLVQTKNARSGPIFSLKLEPAILDQGCRLHRKFGSDRFLEIVVPSLSSWTTPIREPDVSREVIGWLSSQVHHLAGRQWRAFYARDAGRKILQTDVFLDPRPRSILQKRLSYFAEDGFNFDDGPSPDHRPVHIVRESRPKLEVGEMLDWLLQLDRNGHQPYHKLFARIQLGLTKTTAVACLDQNQIRHQQKNIESPTKRVMNDGIGRMSLSLARKVRDVLGLSDIPCTIQGRLGSAKGVWIVDVEDTGSDVWIETWPSQRKWDCDFIHQEYRTLEIKHVAAEPRSASLNIQFLPILEDRAKDKQAMRKFVGDRLLDQLSDEFKVQKDALKHPLQFRQWVNENFAARKQRMTQNSVPFLAGLPESKEEQLTYLIDGGFEPTKQKFMQDMLWELRRARYKNLLKKMNIKIPSSAYLYMVVDFWDILEENEVHICFSSTFRTESFSDSMLHECDVLVARSPAHIASDIQKVKAVFKPELRALKDVVVFSAKGDIALADKLSGGDYDGDRAWVCWEPVIVSNFENAAIPAKPDISKYLRKDETSYGDLTREIDKPLAALAMITRGIVFNMQPSFLGIATKFKEQLCYNLNDVDNEQALLLSALLGSLVDQSKQGFEFTERDWRSFERQVLNGCAIQKMIQPAYEHETWMGGGDPVHIIDHLKFSVAKPNIEEELRKLNRDTSLSPSPSRELVTLPSSAEAAPNAEYWDADLGEPYNEVERLASTFLVLKNVLRNLNEDLEAIKTKWTTSMASVKDENERPSLMVDVFKEWCAIEPRADRELDPWLVAYLKPSHAPEGLSMWALIRASASFKRWYRHKPKLLWRMAGIQLQFIKSMASRDKTPVTVVPSMYAALKPDSKFISQAVSRMKEGMQYSGVEFRDDTADDE
ncbi:RNA-directed RNA polymerase [Colletotrichum abscissum]|uniref:RNA-dependent RNA polymerase n=1 Tax=Colletotrichum abscissum TaxID=1671311 RepID=A0A9Q0AWX6_9PEZI|nr:RNA-directed RNA polymerase [Colletotrichum abscissum]